MSDPKPDGPPEPNDPDGTPVENPSGLKEGGIAANQINPDVPWINPTSS